MRSSISALIFNLIFCLHANAETLSCRVWLANVKQADSKAKTLGLKDFESIHTSLLGFSCEGESANYIDDKTFFVNSLSLTTPSGIKVTSALPGLHQREKSLLLQDPSGNEVVCSCAIRGSLEN